MTSNVSSDVVAAQPLRLAGAIHSTSLIVETMTPLKTRDCASRSR